MRQSILDGAPDTACDLARRALAAGLAPLDAMQNDYVPGIQAVGDQFAQGKMRLPDMMASAEAMRAAMAVLDPELKNLESNGRWPALLCWGRRRGISTRLGRFWWELCFPRMASECMLSEWMLREKSLRPRRAT
jgi:hypothetical protein